MESRHSNNLPHCTAKVDISSQSNKDILLVLDYFRYKVGTSLDCARATGILRNSITWYIKCLEEANLLQAVCRKRDRTTGFKAKHYTADKSLWKPTKARKLYLFGEEAEYVG